MKWKSKPKWSPRDNIRKIGRVRIKERFLLLPKCIDGEWRWLEKACYKQMYTGRDINGELVFGWEDVSWKKRLRR